MLTVVTHSVSRSQSFDRRVMRLQTQTSYRRTTSTTTSTSSSAKQQQSTSIAARSDTITDSKAEGPNPSPALSTYGSYGIRANPMTSIGKRGVATESPYLMRFQSEFKDIIYKFAVFV